MNLKSPLQFTACLMCALSVSTINGQPVNERRVYNDLPEVVVETRKRNVLHMLAYVREYSTLSTYTDTVFMFREKMVDFMLPYNHKTRFKGWKTPRMLQCKSYYHITNAGGLDSVSDVSDHHFSWSDWVGVPNATSLPQALENGVLCTDTIHGRYSPSEIWTKDNDRVSVSVNVLADTTSRRWVPHLSGFFEKKLDFENFKIRFDYENVLGSSVLPSDLTGYIYDIDSEGRGRNMFRFNKPDEPFFVTTHAEVYFLDREYITLKEARKWEKHEFDHDDIEIVQPVTAPELPSSIQLLMARVDLIDSDRIRLNVEPDRKLGNGKTRAELRKNFQMGNRLLLMLKQLTGISLIKSRKNQKDNWNNYVRKKKHGNDEHKNDEHKEDED